MMTKKISHIMNQQNYYAYHTELPKLKHGTGIKATTQQNELYKIRRNV